MAQNPNRRRMVAAVAGVVLAAAALVSVPSAAFADVQQNFVVSADGSGAACSSTAPCALATAQSQVRALTATMTGDLRVQLMGGTYTPTSTLTFGPVDSGHNGHTVVYEAVPGQQVSISGARPITGWTLHDSGKNIWQAAIPVGFQTRQLYVNGVRAQLAEQNASVLGTITQTPTGYTISNSGVSSWANLTDLDFHFPGGGQTIAPHSTWTDSMCSVASVSGTTVTMDSACFARATNGTNGPGVNIPTYIEDNYELLGQPGQFYADAAAGTVYYVPRDGEDLSASTVVAPSLQTLMALSGSTSDPVHDMRFSGIDFEYATWLPGADGVVPLQAGDIESGSGATPDMAMIPAAVALHGAQRVTFSGNSFQHLGGSGISTDGGSQEVSITGNVVTDVAANGIEVGVGDFAAPPAALESDILVDNNSVHAVANQYLGAVGIFAGYVKHTSIRHNDVWDVPYSGISLGWGWGVTSDMIDNHVDNNRVHDVMSSLLTDGSGIYVNGPQTGSPASTINDNYVSDIGSGASLYLDGVSSNWTVGGNVTARLAAGMPWLEINGGNHITATGNYSDTTTTTTATIGTDLAISGNSTGLSTWSAGATASILGAGLEAAYAGITNGPATSNLAYGKTTSVSSTLSSGTPGSLANDGKSMSIWSPSGTDTAAFWQVDLGASYALSDIQILWRQDLDQTSAQASFAVWLSETPDMATHTVACSQGTSPLPFRSTFDCVMQPGSARYVRVVKTDGTYFTLAEVKVFGQQDSDVALGGTATASSTLLPGFGPEQAIDNDVTTGWSPTGSDTALWWEADLGQQFTLSQFRLVTRQGQDQGDATRENFEVWVSNSADMTSDHTVACVYTSPALPYQSTYTCPLPAGPWRYLAVLKTDGTYWFLPEVRIYGH